MYWKIAEQYFSEETHSHRVAIRKIERWLANPKANLGTGSSADMAELYRMTFHDAEFGTDNKQVDIDARRHIQFLNQIGVLLRKHVVDRDLTFSMIGVGLEVDYPVLKVILQAHRTAHNLGRMYSGFDSLWEQYQKWKSQ